MDARTFTVEHVTGATWTSVTIEEAVTLTGWEGWRATDVDDLPVGLDLAAVKNKDDLTAFAGAVLVPLDDVTTRTTRAELEQLITDHLNPEG